MAKAVIGAAEIAAGIALQFVPGGGAIGWGLIFAGMGEELAYVADVLQGNPALAVSAKLPSAPREIIYGTVRKGGVFIYQSTTGHQINEVCVWAAHGCEAILALYIDQRKFYYTDDATLSQRSPYGGGNGDGNTYGDDSGNTYNFAGQTAAWHHCGQGRGAVAWTAGMTAIRNHAGDTASTFKPTLISVAIGGVTYVFGCVVGGTAGSSSGVFSGAAAVGSLVTDGGVTWVNCGPAPGGYWFTQLHNQDTSQWANDCTMTQMCATYLKCTYDSNVFSGPPQLRATIMGKNDIYDPRTGLRGYTNNAALCIADLLCNPEFGFGVDYATGIDETQLIAAANLCDEAVQLAAASQPGAAMPWQPWTHYSFGDQYTYGGGTWTVGSAYTSGASFGFVDASNATEASAGVISESRYTINGYFNTDMEPGQVLASMLMACEGRITRQGGVYKIYPAAWYGTTLTFGQDDLCGEIDWSPSRKFRDRINCVRANFVCPQYPYNVSGYSSDFRNTNIFAGEWQPTDAPPYAQDYLHGYGVITDPYQGDANLGEDGGIRLYVDRRYQFVTSAGQVQRCAKIFLLRNRFQGMGTFPMKLSALRAQVQDVINFNFAYLGMAGTYLEVMKFDWMVKESDDGGGGRGARAILLTTQLELQLTDPSIYEWAVQEEMTLFDQPSPALNNPFSVSPPTSFAVTSDLTTALVAPDGTVTPRLELTWVEPADPFVTSGGKIEIQITVHGAGTWADVLVLAGTAHIAFLGNVVTGTAYDVRVRAVRPGGAYSDWVEVDNVVCGFAASSSGLTPVAPPGTVTASTTSPTNSVIYIGTFSPSVAGFTAACTPSPAVLNGEKPQMLYYVYYIDPTFAGGTITPIATIDPADFVGKPGYFFIGSVLTPPYVGGGSGPRYYPSNFASLGGMYPGSPTDAYDANIATYASIASSYDLGSISTGRLLGEVLFEGFPVITSTAGMALFVSAAASANAGGIRWLVTASIGGGSKAAGSGAGAPNATGAWAATTTYAVWDTFTQAGATYLVVTGYTSGGTFGATDVTNTCILIATGTGNSAQTLYSVPIPTGTALSGITVDATSNSPASPLTTGVGVAISIYEVYAQ